MRILQVSFKNLNSLVGQWQIDLTHPAFASDGILAITGPTGAGKTTILDAICLALYGRTPRLNKINKSGNEIMSRQTGECFAEVTFETGAGRFRCHWSQRRARKKPDGELQAPKHEISEADSGKIFESKIRGVAEQIESVTGMDFDRFTRSMLLAQGGFAAFLQAAPDERAPILEQITGTEIYSQISIRVHERQREEREKLTRLQGETAEIALLEPHEENEMGQTLAAKQKEEAEFVTISKSIEDAIAWHNSIAVLKKQFSELQNEENKLREDMEAFKPNREKLAIALNAATLDGPYATLNAARKQQAEDKKALNLAKQGLPALELAAKQQAEALTLAELQTARAKKEQSTAVSLLQKVRGLDEKIADHQKAIGEGEEGYKQNAVLIASNQDLKCKEQEKHTRAQEDLARVECYLKEHARDEWLSSGLTGLEVQLNNLIARHVEIQTKSTAVHKAKHGLEQAITLLTESQKQSGIHKQLVEDASKKLQQAKEGLSKLLEGRLLREYRTEKETLLREMAFRTRIAELEDHRAKLEDGTPCPLCGATEHPFAQGNVPAPEAIEQKIQGLTKLIDHAEAQEAALKKLETAESSARQQLVEAEKRETLAVHGKTAAEKDLNEIQESLEKLKVDFAKQRKDLASKLVPLGIVDIPETDMAGLLETLKTRQESWQYQVKKKQDLEKQIAHIDSEVKRLDAVLEMQKTSLAEALKQLEFLKAASTALVKKRISLYGNKNPDTEELRLNQATVHAEAVEKQARERHIHLQQNWNTAKVQVETLTERISQQQLKLEKREEQFTEMLAPLGFTNEEHFLASRLSLELRNELTAKAKQLDEHRGNLTARQKEREARLAVEMARNVTEKSLEQLESERTTSRELLDQLRDAISGLKIKLTENRVAKDRIKEKQTLIDAQKKEWSRWENLHKLIGSADGKKYRNFAQGLTFELMIVHANRQLQKMTDRYLLIPDTAQPLEISVIDNYQAGEIRSAKNLSGGESFIVSLSLALGLSQMTSKNVRVDSLFLDEGFGTLDDEALDTALETLASLKQDGKLIGVISHVPALKERIGTQIQVIPLTGGRSQISGPGCSHGGAVNLPGQVPS